RLLPPPKKKPSATKRLLPPPKDSSRHQKNTSRHQEALVPPPFLRIRTRFLRILPPRSNFSRHQEARRVRIMPQGSASLTDFVGHALPKRFECPLSSIPQADLLAIP